jgi:hypothetical protein
MRKPGAINGTTPAVPGTTESIGATTNLHERKDYKCESLFFMDDFIHRDTPGNG